MHLPSPADRVAEFDARLNALVDDIVVAVNDLDTTLDEALGRTA